MTNTNVLADIANEIETLSSDLYKVTATIELLGKPAQLKANEIAAALDDAKDRFSTAIADQAELERSQRLSRFSDIRVDTKPGETLIDTAFVIHYTQDAWDMALNATVPKPQPATGSLPLPMPPMSI